MAPPLATVLFYQPCALPSCGPCLPPLPSGLRHSWPEPMNPVCRRNRGSYWVGKHTWLRDTLDAAEDVVNGGGGLVVVNLKEQGWPRAQAIRGAWEMPLPLLGGHRTSELPGGGGRWKRLGMAEAPDPRGAQCPLGCLSLSLALALHMQKGRDRTARATLNGCTNCVLLNNAQERWAGSPAVCSFAAQLFLAHLQPLPPPLSTSSSQPPTSPLTPADEKRCLH